MINLDNVLFCGLVSIYQGFYTVLISGLDRAFCSVFFTTKRNIQSTRHLHKDLDLLWGLFFFFSKPADIRLKHHIYLDF